LGREGGAFTKFVSEASKCEGAAGLPWHGRTKEKKQKKKKTRVEQNRAEIGQRPLSPLLWDV